MEEEAPSRLTMLASPFDSGDSDNKRPLVGVVRNERNSRVPAGEKAKKYEQILNCKQTAEHR